MNSDKAYSNLGMEPVNVERIELKLLGPDDKTEETIIVDAAQHLKVDDRVLDELHSVLPGLCYYYTSLQARTSRDLERAKMDLTVAEAKSTMAAKLELRDKFGQRGATADATKAMVDTDPDVIAGRKRVADKEYQDKLMRGVLKAIQDKRSSLDEITRNRRKELDYSMRDSMRTGLEGR